MSYYKQGTVPFLTETCEGPIDHLRVVAANGMVIFCPVCIVTNLRGSKGDVIPVRKNGRLVYAWPGGERFLEPVCAPRERKSWVDTRNKAANMVRAVGV